MSKLFYNRLHLTGKGEIKNKNVFYFDGLRSEAAVGENNHSYKITDVTQTGDYILGYLVKYDPYGRGEYLDDKTGKVRQGGTKNNIIAKSLFILNVDESLIAFEEVPNIISKHQFRRVFSELFRENHGGNVKEFSITGITEQYSFIEKVKTLTKIKQINISLVPSNPRNADLWRDTDERLRENNITSYREVMISTDPEGLIVDEETIGKMAMAEDGYGESEARGLDNEGHNVVINTTGRKQELTQNLPNEVEIAGTVSIIDFVKNMFKKVASRTDKA